MSHQTTAIESPVPAYPAKLRAVLSVLLVLHLTAVFIAPFSFATSLPPNEASPFAVGVRNSFRWYIDAAFLDHGYFFFAPNPGPSHLVRFEATFDGNQPSERFLMPDRQRYRPRLFYHRHFMLSESLNTRFVPAPDVTAPDLPGDPEALESWRAARGQYERMRDDFASKVQMDLGASQVEVTRVEHLLLTPAEYSRGMSITDPGLYRDMPDDRGAEGPVVNPVLPAPELIPVVPGE